MNMNDLRKKALPQMPSEIVNALNTSQITSTPFERKNDILSDTELQKEVGCKRLDDGSYLVAMICPMPAITPEMIEWWFWWHPQDSIRYQVWFPDAHISIKYHKKDREFFCQDVMPPFRANTHYPTEKIGGVKMPLRIDFVTPEEFGFSRQLMEENNIPKIVCGHVSAFHGFIKHTEMAHIFKETEEGLFLISRFWLGKTMKIPLLRKLVITEKMAKGMAEHCCVEYRNLAEILPYLYSNTME